MIPRLEIEVPADGLEIEPVELTPVSQSLVEILGADVPLPDLIRWVPDVRLRKAVESATARVLAIAVTGREGLAAADAGLTELRGAIKAVLDDFAEPADQANKLHKRITGMRADWTAEGESAVKLTGRRIYDEQQRLQRIADDERRRIQAEADVEARAAAAREAAAAEAAQAPAAVVEELKQQAQTVTAPPVAVPQSAPAKLAGSATVKTFKARIKGTTGDQEPNPSIAALSAGQRSQVLDLLLGIINGTDPIAAIELNWSYLNNRAKADKKTLAITGIEVYEDGTTRGKGARRS